MIESQARRRRREGKADGFEHPFARLAPAQRLRRQGAGLGARGPLSVPKTLLTLMLTPIDAIVLIALSESLHTALVIVNSLANRAEDIPSVFKVISMAPERRIPFEAFSTIMVRNRGKKTVLLNKGLALRDLNRRAPEVLRSGGGSRQSGSRGRSGDLCGRELSSNIHTCGTELRFSGSNYTKNIMRKKETKILGV